MFAVCAVKPSWAVAGKQILQGPSHLFTMWNFGDCDDTVWICAGRSVEATASKPCNKFVSQ